MTDESRSNVVVDHGWDDFMAKYGITNGNIGNSHREVIDNNSPLWSQLTASLLVCAAAISTEVLNEACDVVLENKHVWDKNKEFSIDRIFRYKQISDLVEKFKHDDALHKACREDKENLFRVEE